jgi:hypothetical protein
LFLHAPVAQLDRASGYGPEGCGFEFYRARQAFQIFEKPFLCIPLYGRISGMTGLCKENGSCLYHNIPCLLRCPAGSVIIENKKG